MLHTSWRWQETQELKGAPSRQFEWLIGLGGRWSQIGTDDIFSFQFQAVNYYYRRVSVRPVWPGTRPSKPDPGKGRRSGEQATSQPHAIKQHLDMDTGTRVHCG